MMTRLIEIHNKQYSSDVTIDDVTQWDLPRDMFEIFHGMDFFGSLKPIPGAIEGVKQLVRWGHDVVVATNHSDDFAIAADKILWVQRYLPELSGNMMLGARKDILQGDIIIDDNPDYLINSPCRIKICMDRPWNRSYGYEFPLLTESGAFAEQWHRKMVVYRVNNWIKILSLLQTNFRCFDWSGVSGKL
jgi:5'(3')-deoxyribonucleotidase